MARFEAPLEDDRLNESQPRPMPDGEPPAILDGSPEIEDLIEDARSLYLAGQNSLQGRRQGQNERVLCAIATEGDDREERLVAGVGFEPTTFGL